VEQVKGLAVEEEPKEEAEAETEAAAVDEEIAVDGAEHGGAETPDATAAAQHLRLARRRARRSRRFVGGPHTAWIL
jgi:hypothetical protein